MRNKTPSIAMRRRLLPSMHGGRRVPSTTGGRRVIPLIPGGRRVMVVATMTRKRRRPSEQRPRRSVVRCLRLRRVYPRAEGEVRRRPSILTSIRAWGTYAAASQAAAANSSRRRLSSLEAICAQSRRTHLDGLDHKARKSRRRLQGAGTNAWLRDSR